VAHARARAPGFQGRGVAMANMLAMAAQGQGDGGLWGYTAA